MKKISLISLFPQVFEEYLAVGMLARAQNAKKIIFNLVDLRQFGIGRSRQVDDTPYGGGAGLILTD